jgi:hypothetical protein
MKVQIIVIGIAILMLPMTFAAPTAVQSGENDQGIFGGISIEVSNTTSASTQASMAEYPDIAEVYTATWCENCVPAEEGLYAAIAESSGNVTVLAFHRAIGEAEDPFGVQAVDERWESRYGAQSKKTVSQMRAPPTMIINGEYMHAGTAGYEGELLKPYYSESLAIPTYFSEQSANSSLTWSSEDKVNGTVTWSLEAGEWLPESSTSLLFVVEAAAYFENGSNGLGTYHDIVRDMVELDGNSGSMDYTLPGAWDGDDLSLVLVHQWEIYPVIIVDPPVDEGFLGLPAAGVLLLAVSLVGAAITAAKRSTRLH